MPVSRSAIHIPKLPLSPVCGFVVLLELEEELSVPVAGISTAAFAYPQTVHFLSLIHILCI